MVLYDHSHVPNEELRTRVKDLSIAGIPVYLIAKVLKIDPDTLVKYYDYELSCAEPEAVERIAKVVAIQAEQGDPRAQALYLKTKGAKYGWVEKQVIEHNAGEDTQALKDQIAALELKHEREY